MQKFNIPPKARTEDRDYLHLDLRSRETVREGLITMSVDLADISKSDDTNAQK